MLWRNGFNVLMIDARDTGDSTFDDLRSTIGNDEYWDVLGAWDWLVAEKGLAPAVYIVHTHGDTRIAISQSEQLAAAAQAAGVKVTTWFPENGEHVQTPAAYQEEFEQRLVGFFRETLGP